MMLMKILDRVPVPSSASTAKTQSSLKSERVAFLGPVQHRLDRSRAYNAAAAARLTLPLRSLKNRAIVDEVYRAAANQAATMSPAHTKALFTRGVGCNDAVVLSA